jgi:DNA repair exonuclease SbcCD nuclease subunit
MSAVAFRFIHASDLHVDRPIGGLAETPEHLFDAIVDAPMVAAKNVFDAAIAEEVDFVVLSGDVIDARRASPGELAMLVEQFRRLAERGIRVYWVGGQVDPVERWPSAIALGENVHRFSAERVESIVHRRGATALAKIVGRPRRSEGVIRPSDYSADEDGLYTLAVGHGAATVESLQSHSIQYWALGGEHSRRTLFASPATAHYPGAPQSRSPEETGPHSCTLVQVDQLGAASAGRIVTDAIRWHQEEIRLDASSSREALEAELCQRMQAIAAASSGRMTLVRWTLAGTGTLAASLQRGSTATELVAWLRSQWGHAEPIVWTAEMEVAPAAVLAETYYEQETMLGDLLRRVRDLQLDETEPLDLAQSMSEAHAAGILPERASLAEPAARRRTLAQVAELGVDLFALHGATDGRKENSA